MGERRAGKSSLRSAITCSSHARVAGERLSSPVAIAVSSESETDSTTAWLASMASVVVQALVVIGVVLMVMLCRGAAKRGVRKSLLGECS